MLFFLGSLGLFPRDHVMIFPQIEVLLSHSLMVFSFPQTIGEKYEKFIEKGTEKQIVQNTSKLQKIGKILPLFGIFAELACVMTLLLLLLDPVTHCFLKIYFTQPRLVVAFFTVRIVLNLVRQLVHFQRIFFSAPQRSKSPDFIDLCWNDNTMYLEAGEVENVDRSQTDNNKPDESIRSAVGTF